MTAIGEAVRAGSRTRGAQPVAEGVRGAVVESAPEVPGADEAGERVRERVALAQTALLSALVAGTPVPEGFDRTRLGIQARALAAKRAGVVAKVAPELPAVLGTAYRPAFLSYAQSRPMGAATARTRWTSRSGPC